MISEMQGRIETSLVTEDVITDFTPVLKALEDGVYFDPGLLKNSILKCFWWLILHGNEKVYSKHCPLNTLF